MPTSFDWLAIYSSVVATVALEPSPPGGLSRGTAKPDRCSSVLR